MHQKFCMLLACWLSCLLYAQGQINFTANDQVPEFNDYFGFGTNMGYYPPWQDEQLADIAFGNPEKGTTGVGITAFRPSLPNHFLEQWGYDIRIDAFRHYEKLGARNNVIFVGFPAAKFRETTVYCDKAGEASHHFKNLYEPIWDNGENGTPVNDNNHLALYLYKTVSRYKNYARFWEIWNEPDYDYTGHSERNPGEANNWWDEDPSPCDYKLRAPIQHYIRTLRVSYEVIKSIDPQAYVALGGIGYPSFADAILRNTDNPDGGKVTELYPLYGGAYFDVMSYHTYPHIDGSLREWSNLIFDFKYHRHSDAAVAGVLKKRNDIRTVLEKHGYNNEKYPRKKWIITEANIPAKPTRDFIGSDIAQVNFLIKTLVTCMKENILQFDVYNLGEAAPSANGNDFKKMGLYKSLTNVKPYQQQLNPAGVAYKSCAQFLRKAKYDPIQTARLDLPEAVAGSAFINERNDYVYVLWAKTHTDQTETADADYQFPAWMTAEKLYRSDWEFSANGIQKSINPKQAVPLNGSPQFFSTAKKEETTAPLLRIHPNPFYSETTIEYKLNQTATTKLAVYDLSGNQIALLQNETIQPPGSYTYKWAHKKPGKSVYYVTLWVGEKKYSAKAVSKSE